jgi:hypothetical protein
MMEHGGCAMKIGVFIITKCTYARYSHQHGANSLSPVNGEEIPLVDHTLFKQIEMKKQKILMSS